MPEKNPYAEIEAEVNPYAAIENEANESLKKQGSIMAEYPQFLGGAYENPGIAGVASSGINALSNIAGLVPHTDESMIGRFQDWSAEQAGAYKQRFGNDPYAALGRISTDMLLAMGAAKTPARSYTGQIAQGAGAGYLVGGPEGAGYGALTAGVLGGPQAANNAFKRQVAFDEMGSLLNPFNRQVRLDIPSPVVSSPAYQEGLATQRRLGTQLSVGQKAANLRTLTKEKGAMGVSGQLERAKEFTNRQAQALDRQAQAGMNRISPVTDASKVGEGIKTASQKQLSKLVRERRAVWDDAFQGIDENVRNIELGAYEDALEKVIAENNLKISTPMMRQIARSARSRLEQVYTPEKTVDTGLLNAKGQPISKTIPEQHLKGTAREVQQNISEAGKNAYAGPSPFQTVRSAAETRVDRIIKGALDDVIDDAANKGSMEAAALRKARDAFREKSKLIDEFESSELGRLLELSTKEGKQLAPEQAVRALIKNKNASEVLAAKKVLQDQDPALWKSIERQYMEMLVGAGRTRPLEGYADFGPNQFMSRKPVRGDLNAPAETSREIMEAILSPEQIRFMDQLYKDAGRLGLHTPPAPQAGSRDVSRLSQEGGVAAGMIQSGGKFQGPGPFIGKLLAEPLSGPRLNALLNPEVEAMFLNPQFQRWYGPGGAMAYPILEAYRNRGILSTQEK